MPMMIPQNRYNGAQNRFTVSVSGVGPRNMTTDFTNAIGVAYASFNNPVAISYTLLNCTMVASGLSTYALRSTGALPANSRMTVIWNNSTAYGATGTGGHGGSISCYSPEALYVSAQRHGGTGGVCIYMTHDLEFKHSGSGYIYGGAGGGGAGQGVAATNSFDYYGSTGGGGAGLNGVTASYCGEVVYSGSAPQTAIPPNGAVFGGNAYHVQDGVISFPSSWCKGGQGGYVRWGQSGTSGSAAVAHDGGDTGGGLNFVTTAAGNGGAPGDAIRTNGNTLLQTSMPTVTGPIS